MERICFGDYVFEPRQRLLTRRSRWVHLTPKALQLLELLLRSRPVAVTRIDIIEHMWPDSFVSEHSLTNLVSEIRKALRSDGVPYVRTVHGVGYAFCADATVVPSSSKEEDLPPCYLIEGGPHSCRFGIYEGVTVIGRASSCDVSISAPTVSRRHARIRLEGGVATIDDLGSRHGTWVRGRRISAPVRLVDGDGIRFGPVPVTYHVAIGAGEDTDDLPKTDNGCR